MSSQIQINRFGRLVGSSPAMQRLFKMVAKAAKTDVPVLLTGETGTGKDLAAQEIHERSRRRNRIYEALNTGTLTTDLIASELFGHVRGAFTGANQRKVGRFAEANGGTLFLDEISTMEDRVQVALLRVLETGTYRPVGGDHDERTNARIIAATNIDLHHAALSGHFREDLLHRLEVFRIPLPPLRRRKEDVPQLAYHFLQHANEDYSFDIAGFTAEAMEALMAYSWPGNVRELKNVVTQAAVMAENGVIRQAHLPQRIAAPSAKDADSDEAPLHSESALADEIVPIAVEPPDVERRAADFRAAQEGVFIPMGSTLGEAEKAVVLKTLAHCDNNKTHAARILGVSRKTLYDKLTRWRGREE